MKIVTQLKNTKADKAAKQSHLLNAHNKLVRYAGQSYRIIVAKVGTLLLADAENMVGYSPRINLFGTDTSAKDIRKLCEQGLYS
jgi:hypothetical protein